MEIQELQDISRNFYTKRAGLAKTDEDDSEDSADTSEINPEERPAGIMALAEAHRNRIQSRDALKQMCNQIMENYEEAEAEASRKQQQAMNEPDEDGFVTVSYSTNVGDAVDFEKKGNIGSGRRKRERTRSSKKNLVKGSDQLQDFYRFQLKESKKRNLEDLKARFQDDLKRVKQMSDEKKYRPF